MGAKKKKSLANKLAKMSDEERARYLQNKADAEEEARRRKEQLIAMFIKNKIKREDAFSRLNLAKINQEWHQILRKAKCKEMKDNVGHLKNWMERVVNLKNRTIDNLMLELDEAELQYSYNFQAHISHIQQIISVHQEYMNKMQEEYEYHCKELLETSVTEIEEIKTNSKNNEMFLKTLLFGLDKTMNEDIRKQKERYMNKYDDAISSQHLELEKLTKSREAVSAAIWREIARMLKEYVQRTDHRRLHLAELKRLDAESAAEITENQERITRAKIEIQRLKELNILTRESYESKLTTTKENWSSIQKTFRVVRDQLQSELKLDEKKLAFLATSSGKALNYLKTVLNKGTQITTLTEICNKFETEEEKVVRYQILFRKEADVTDETVGETIVKISTPELERATELLRPTTSKPKRRSSCLSNRRSALTVDDLKPEKPVDRIMLEPKRETRESQASSQKKTNFMENAYKPLFDLEHLWMVHSRVKVDLLELQLEKRNLLRENQQLKELLKNILEEVVLKRSVPCTRISSGIVTHKIRGRSAPPKCFL